MAEWAALALCCPLYQTVSPPAAMQQLTEAPLPKICTIPWLHTRARTRNIHNKRATVKVRAAIKKACLHSFSSGTVRTKAWSLSGCARRLSVVQDAWRCGTASARAQHHSQLREGRGPRPCRTKPWQFARQQAHTAAPSLILTPRTTQGSQSRCVLLLPGGSGPNLSHSLQPLWPPDKWTSSYLCFSRRLQHTEVRREQTFRGEETLRGSEQTFRG